MTPVQVLHKISTLALLGWTLTVQSACTIDRRTKAPLSQPDAAVSADIADDAASNNIPPGPLKFALGPLEPTTLDDLTVEVTEEAYDPDQGPEALSLVVRWFRDNQTTLHGGNSLPSQATQRGETWRVEVAAFDGELEGPTTSAEVTIVNAPPTLTSPTLSPANPSTDDVLLCGAAEATDPDGDSTSHEYAWFIDGELQLNESESALLPPIPPDVDIRCASRAFDGQLNSEWFGSNTVKAATKQAQSGMLFVAPKALDLGTVLPEEIAKSSLTIRNIGVGDLIVSDANVEGDGFSLETPLPLTLASEEESTLTLAFQTNKPGLKKGKLVLESNATNPGEGAIPLLGLGASPCLNVSSYIVDFGGVYPPATLERKVELTSCGALPIVIESVDFNALDGAPFNLDTSEGPGTFPWELSPGETALVRVTYNPMTASEVGADGSPILDEGTLSIHSNTVASPTVLSVQGFASATGCPVAFIESIEGHTVMPGTKVTLSGAKSFGIFGAPGKFAWSVSSVPDGQAIEAVHPAPSAEVVTYDLSAPGVYEFHLKVFDQTTADGAPCGAPDAPCAEIIPSCTTAIATVEAKNAIPLIVELTWDTPGDANQSDTGPGKGGDMDLHLHNGQGQMADYDGDGYPDSFFDESADCYWFDTSPDWGVPGEANDPVLVQEDADGSGPERIQVDGPGNGPMTIGVHYWSAFDYGPSIPTVRVYHFETLTYEVVGEPLQHGDLWEAATIAWPSASISPAFSGTGGPKVTPAYPTPF